MNQRRHTMVTLILLIGMLVSPMTSVNGQSPEANQTITTQINFYIKLTGQDPIFQSEASYEIYRQEDLDLLGEEAQVVASYSGASSSSASSHALAPGDYVLRLYDGAGFVREGVAIDGLSASLVSPGNQEGQPLPPGRVIESTRGRFYEFPFQLAADPSLLDSASQSYQVTYDLVLGEGTGEEGSTTTSASSGLNLQVTDSNYQPLPGVEVTIEGVSYTSDQEGLISLPDVMIDQAISGSVQVSPDQEARPFSLQPNPGQTTLTLEVSPVGASQPSQEVGSYSVSVVTINGLGQEEVLSGVEVNLGEESQTTNDQGQAYFSDLPVGYYILSVTRLDSQGMEEVLVEETVTVVAREDQERVVQVTSHQADPQLRVITQNEEGSPLTGVSLEVEGQTYTSDAQGEISLNLPHGVYTGQVTQAPEGYLVPSQSIDLDLTGDQAQTIELEAVPSYSSLVIEVVDQDGGGVPGATVQVGDRTYPVNEEGQAILTQVQVGETYNYGLAHVPEGYEVVADQGGQVTPLADQEVTQQIQVTRLLTPASLTIQVTDQTDQPVEQAQVSLSSSGQTSQTLTTNEEGQVVVSDLATGTWLVTITQLPSNYQTSTETTSTELVEGANQTLDLSVTRDIPQSQVKLSFTDQLGQPLADIQVSLNAQTLKTNQEGQLESLNLDPGEYTYQVSQLPDKFPDSLEGTLTVEEGQDLEETITLDRQVDLGQASIQVIDQNQEPVSGATVTMGGLSGTTDDQGNVSFQDLELGTYYYTISGVPQGYRPYLGGDHSLEIGEGDHHQEVLTLERRPREGQVRIQIKSQGQNQPGVEVKLGDQTAFTDDQGYVEFTQLEPGQTLTYGVIQVPDGSHLEPSRGEVQVEANQTQQVVLNLSQTDKTTSQEGIDQDQASDQTTSLAPPVDQADLAAAGRQATHTFHDEETGVQVRLNPEDAKEAVKIQVTKQTDPAEPLAGDLAGYQADIYDVQVLDRFNQPVATDHVVEVVLPSRPVTRQLEVYQINQAQTQPIQFQVNQQQVSFYSQSLGSYGIKYAPKDQDQLDKEQAMLVSKETGVESNRGWLPSTGEALGWTALLGVGLLLAGIGLVNKRKR